MFTRKQFINNECTHSQYYSQFVDNQVRQLTAAWIGTRTILESIDPNFNDIPSSRWDLLYEVMYSTIGLEKVKKCGDYFSIVFSACVAKEAALQIRNQQSS